MCVDAMFYGNESRFINHSCDPNVQPFNISGEAASDAVNRIGLFAWKNIHAGDEITIDYQWDKGGEIALDIPSDIKCLCGSNKCRGYLIQAKKIDTRKMKK